MFGLVRFSDNSEGIYPMKNIYKKNGHRCIVKHKGCKFEAEILAVEGEFIQGYIASYSLRKLLLNFYCDYISTV